MILFGSFNPEAQADALLNHAIETELSASGLLSAIDDSGYVWLVGRFDRKLCVSRIDPEGNLAFDRVPIPAGDFSTGEQLIFDRWGNAYFIFNNDVGGNPGLVNLVRITPEGQAEDRYPWRVKQLPYPYYMVILPGDTLVTYAQAYSGPGEISVRPWTFQIGKVHLTVDGYGAAQQTLHKMEEFPHHLYWTAYSRPFIEWGSGWAIQAHITTPYTLDYQLKLYRQHLTTESEYAVDTLGSYDCQDIIWREYSDAYVPGLLFSRYKKGGYLLFYSIHNDPSAAYTIRLDQDCRPIRSIKPRRKKSARPFDELPLGSAAYVNIEIKNKVAQIFFWGCDDEGNLYAYRKVKKF